MECKEIIGLLEKIAPPCYASGWDNCGLLVGRDNKDIKKIMVALDCTDNVINQAIKNGVDMLITHHPLIFSPIKSVNYNDFVGRRIYKLAVNDISYYAAHTNMDAGVMADEAAKMLDMVNTKPLEITYEKKMYKVVVFVPEQYAQKLCEAMVREGASPFMGSINQISSARDIRIESSVSQENLDKVIRTIVKNHPYEDVDYDVYEISNSPLTKGIGKVGYLDYEMKLSELARLVKDRFELDYVLLTGDEDMSVVRAAISPGAGKSMIKHAVKAGVNVLITGDIDHHSALDAYEQGLSIIDAGHFGTEHFVVDYIRDYLYNATRDKRNDIFSDADGIEIIKAVEKAPFKVL